MTVAVFTAGKLSNRHFFFSLIPWILTDFCWTYYTCVREGGEGVQLGVAGAADPGAVEGEGFGVGV